MNIVIIPFLNLGIEQHNSSFKTHKNTPSIVLMHNLNVSLIFFQVTIPDFDSINLDKYQNLKIAPPEDFPGAGETRIPKIIHQTWKSTEIPYHYVDWVKSWRVRHPDWSYMFWTDDDARRLIADKYPSLLPYYDGYTENIRRADAMRYVILYEYGGVYADLDVESLLPLDPITRKYSCILPQEPYEHPVMDKNFEHLVINAFLACKAKHPIMKKFLDNLPAFSHMWNVLDSTGPHYITLLYRQYISETKHKPTDDDGVYLAPPEYFFPTIDPVKFSYMKDMCLKFDTLSELQKRGCISLKLNGMDRKPFSFSFTDHHWIHTYLGDKFIWHGPVDIKELVGNVQHYKPETVENTETQ